MLEKRDPPPPAHTTAAEVMATIFPHGLTFAQRQTIAEARQYSGVVVLAAPGLFKRVARI